MGAPPAIDVADLVADLVVVTRLRASMRPVLYDEATGVLARLQCGGAVPAGSAIEPAGDNPEIYLR